MRIEEFNYTLPSSLVAQYPSSQRGESRLMVLERSQGTIEHRDFQDILDYFHPGDLLVMNNTRVLPARLIGKKETGGKCEILLIPSRNGTKGVWEVLIKGSGRGTFWRSERDEEWKGKDLFLRSGRGDGNSPEDWPHATPSLHQTGRRAFGQRPLPNYLRRERGIDCSTHCWPPFYTFSSSIA
jgi:S-adenosylmethionine:tRNA ribosyltransferase-isomerase